MAACKPASNLALPFPRLRLARDQSQFLAFHDKKAANTKNRRRSARLAVLKMTRNCLGLPHIRATVNRVSKLSA
jgi:hypothetical protein